MSSIRPILFLLACSFTACSSFGSGDPIKARPGVATLEGFCAELADTVVRSCGLTELEARQELESDCRRNAGTRNPGGYRPELGEACIVQLEAFDASIRRSTAKATSRSASATTTSTV